MHSSSLFSGLLALVSLASQSTALNLPRAGSAIINSPNLPVCSNGNDPGPSNWVGSATFQEWCTGDKTNEGSCRCNAQAGTDGKPIGPFSVHCSQSMPDEHRQGGNLDAYGDIKSQCLSRCSCS